MNPTYKTISKASEGLYKEKGSKFIGIAIPVKSEEQIKEHLEEIKKQYHDARHHCYAWMLGYDRNQFRANDDGEPSNSAGKPILGQIESFELTNVLIVVVRYFGGTKLGVGGLITAYKSAAKEALDNADIFEDTVKQGIEFTCDYADMPHVMNLIKENQFEIVKQEMEANCTLGVEIEMDQVEFLKAKLGEFKSVELTKDEIL
ncbi:MAG: YigZ family protein [Crocinitomicaceae bacterium]